MKPYQPISCDFYDILEALAVRKQPVRIEFMENGAEHAVENVRITDLQTRNKEEFVYLDDGKEIRLDHLLTVDGKPLPGSCRI